MLKVDSVKADHAKCREETSTSQWGQLVSFVVLVFRFCFVFWFADSQVS